MTNESETEASEGELRAPTLRQLLEVLHAEGLTKPVAELDLTAAEHERREAAPWFVRVLVGFGAWVAALMFFVVLMLMDLYRSSAAMMLVGALLHAGALFIRRQVRGDFFAQLALSLNLLGPGLLLAGAAVALEGGVTTVAAVAILISAYMVIIDDDVTQRFLYAYAGGSALYVFGSTLFMTEYRAWSPVELSFAQRVPAELMLLVLSLAAAVALVHRFRSIGVQRAAGPVGHGLLFVVFSALLSSAAAHSARELTAYQLTPLVTVGLSAGLLFLEARLLREHAVKLDSPAALVLLGATVALAALTYRSPGVLGAVAALTIGFRRRSWLLIGIATVFLGLFLFNFYYGLTLTLLQKSLSLLFSGLLLLGARLYARRIAPEAA